MTGATGQLGKVVLEKLLRSFPEVKAIYLAIRVKDRAKADDEAYERYRSEIKDSQIFDTLKMELGAKAFSKLLRRKVRVIPMDLAEADLSLSAAHRQELAENVHYIINCAGIVDLDTSLELQTEVNVTGALALMTLAEECPNLLCFAHVSTTYAYCEQRGFVDETLFASPNHDWAAEHKQICEMGPDEIAAAQASLIGRFPSNYCYTKRMAEELLVARHRALS